jgi:hypothetical protein
MRWEPSRERKPLLRSMQVGVLPTMSFWLRGDLRHVLVPTYLFGLASAVVLSSALGASPLVGALLGATLPLLGVGLLERYVRRAVERRRTKALPIASSR